MMMMMMMMMMMTPMMTPMKKNREKMQISQDPESINSFTKAFF